ncbi:hypothetical protein BDC45DRAFT_525308 [Circinella umbellata]|nr:hypothetical protein BDC45DRAFT_525308 [Circinella umbellata]
MKNSLVSPSESHTSLDNTTQTRNKASVPVENNAVITSEIVPVYQVSSQDSTLSRLENNVERSSIDLAHRSQNHRISMNDDNIAGTVTTITGDSMSQTLNNDGDELTSLKRQRDNDDKNDDTTEESLVKRVRSSQEQYKVTGSTQNNSSEEKNNDIKRNLSDKKKSKEAQKNVKIFYCPYKNCHVQRNKDSFMINHIRESHDSNIEMTITGTSQNNSLKSHAYACVRTGMVVYFDGASRNTLNSNDKLIPLSQYNQLEELGKKGEQRYYCPYKDCRTSINNRADHLYRHIRTKHYQKFPLLPVGGHKEYVFRTSRDQILDFRKESSRDMLNQGEPILNATFKDIKLFHCPYIGCTSNVFTAYSNTFVHIKKCHNPDLVIPSTMANCEYVFRHPTSREIMTFDDVSSRKTLSKTQQLIIGIKDQDESNKEGHNSTTNSDVKWIFNN